MADLEVLQAVAQRLGNKDSFLGGACGRIRAHPNAVQAGPASGFEELRPVLDCLRRYCVVVSLRLAHDFTDLRMLWFGRIRSRFPVSELARVASKAQNAS